MKIYQTKGVALATQQDASGALAKLTNTALHRFFSDDFGRGEEPTGIYSDPANNWVIWIEQDGEYIIIHFPSEH